MLWVLIILIAFLWDRIARQNFMLPPIWARNGTRQRSLSPCWWYVHCPLSYIVVWTRHGVYCLANTCQLRGTMSACIARPTTKSALASPYSSQTTIWQLDALHLCEGRICFNQDWYSRQNYSWKLYASKDTLAWENPYSGDQLGY